MGKMRKRRRRGSHFATLSCHPVCSQRIPALHVIEVIGKFPNFLCLLLGIESNQWLLADFNESFLDN